MLDWVTVTETNNSHFEVERSFDTNTFKTVAIVLDGFEGKADTKNYKFKENLSNMQGHTVAYYRLKQIDMNGAYTYSEVLTVSVKAQIQE